MGGGGPVAAFVEIAAHFPAGCGPEIREEAAQPVEGNAEGRFPARLLGGEERVPAPKRTGDPDGKPGKLGGSKKLPVIPPAAELQQQHSCRIHFKVYIPGIAAGTGLQKELHTAVLVYRLIMAQAGYPGIGFPHPEPHVKTCCRLPQANLRLGKAAIFRPGLMLNRQW